MLAVLQFVIGILDCVPNYEKRPNVIWAQASMMVVWNFAYSLSVGPVCFVILCECSATKVRSKTIALATAVQAMLGIVMTVAIPYMINPDAANWRGKLGFFFGVRIGSSTGLDTGTETFSSRALLRYVSSGLFSESQRQRVGRMKSLTSCLREACLPGSSKATSLIRLRTVL